MVLAVLQPKQPATLPFEFIAAVKNTTPLVGCAEPGVISDVSRSCTCVVFVGVLCAGRARKDNSQTKKSNASGYGKNVFHNMPPSI